MADEIEIKLRVPPAALRKVEKLGWLQPLIHGPVKRESLRSVYFDTPKFKLRDHGVVLRVRHIGRKRVQTVKAEGEGAFTRKEWECEISGARPDFDKLEDTALEPLLNGKLKRNLKPAFETVVTRRAIPLRIGETIIELALDRGQIKAASREDPVSEIEIELKSGDPIEIVRLAERLAAEVPASYEVRSKPERGYALRAGEMNCAVRAQAVALHDKMTTAEAFRTIGFECLRQVATNQAAVLAADTEGVHQMRVGLRRLRAAMSIFKELLGDDQSEAIKSELKWLTEQLGPARDLDVFVRESVAPLQEAASEMDVLRVDMEKRRDAGFLRAQTAVESDRYRRLILQVALWLANGEWGSDAVLKSRRDHPAADFAAEVLEQRIEKIMAKANKLKKLDPHKRHKLRIGIKKLRYATEFFAALFDGGKRRKRLTETLEELQDDLGRLNDFATHQKLAGDIVQHGKHKDRRPEKAFAMGIVTGREQAKIDACLAAAKKASNRLKAHRAFWQ